MDGGTRLESLGSAISSGKPPGAYVLGPAAGHGPWRFGGVSTSGLSHQVLDLVFRRFESYHPSRKGSGVEAFGTASRIGDSTSRLVRDLWEASDASWAVTQRSIRRVPVFAFLYLVWDLWRKR